MSCQFVQIPGTNRAIERLRDIEQSMLENIILNGYERRDSPAFYLIKHNWNKMACRINLGQQEISVSGR